MAIDVQIAIPISIQGVDCIVISISLPDMENSLAIDIGGTFTDVVLQRGGRIFATKVLTSHDDPSLAVMTGIDQIFSESEAMPVEIGIILHGTTLATNALITRSGATTALLTTAGHRDVLEMALENRFEQYDINIERPRPLVPRKLRLPILERMDSRGNVLIPVDHGSVQAAIETLKREEIESIAIGFLHAFVNDEHEQAVSQMVSERMGDVPISLASDVCPEIREYERLSTTCANAYVLPLMNTYLTRLANKLDSIGFKCPYLMMTSGGGLTTFETAGKYPIRLVESGPAGGAILAEQIAKETGENKVLSFDMGGTTAKICLIDEGKSMLSRAFEVDRAYRFKKGSGLPVRIPVIEMVEIGAGGGSIARVDKLSRVQVGPESAGSEPGPACYGRNGIHPTVTDADCVLGRLDAESFAGGNLHLKSDAALTAIKVSIADSLGTDSMEAAKGIAEIVDENMAAAARSHASEWGKSLQQRTLIAFGGAAPLHAARLVEKLDLSGVLIPKDAGVGSAIGFLNAPISFEVVRSSHMYMDHYDSNLVSSVLKSMYREASSVVSKAANSSNSVERATAYMRYVGQGHEITVPFDPSDVSKESLQNSFEAAYIELYGRLIPDARAEVMSWTLNIAVRRDEIGDGLESNETTLSSSRVPSQNLNSSADHDPCSLLNREHLGEGEVKFGPLLVTELHTTTFVPHGFSIRLTPAGHLFMERNLDL